MYHKKTLGAEILASEIPGDFDGDGQVRFNDFFLFADGFGTTDPKYDLNDSGLVDFDDFFIFADNFGKTERAKLITLAEQMIGLPRETALAPNFPNPFNADTTIRYSVSVSSHIVIDVYDLTGQSIKRLVEFYHAPGHYTIQWDGTNAVTDIVSSGMYVVSMRAEGMMKTQKIMFLK